jgi:hypothetical protein
MVPAGIIERCAEERRGRSRVVVPPDGSEQHARLAAHRAGHRGNRMPQYRHGPIRISGLEQGETQRKGATPASVKVGVGREPKGCLEELRCGQRRSAALSRVGGRLELSSHSGIGSRRRQRRLTGSLLVIGDGRSEGPVGRPSVRGGRSAIHGGREQGVREAEFVTIQRDDAGAFAGVHRRPDVLARKSPLDRRKGRTCKRCDDNEHADRGIGYVTEAACQERL